MSASRLGGDNWRPTWGRELRSGESSAINVEQEESDRAQDIRGSYRGDPVFVSAASERSMEADQRRVFEGRPGRASQVDNSTGDLGCRGSRDGRQRYEPGLDICRRMEDYSYNVHGTTMPGTSHQQWDKCQQRRYLAAKVERHHRTDSTGSSDGTDDRHQPPASIEPAVEHSTGHVEHA